MPIPIKIAVTDELLDILASWSIEEIRQLIEEFEVTLGGAKAINGTVYLRQAGCDDKTLELRHRPAPPRGALRSRRANASRRPRRRTDGPRC
jgi:hypothetical protein